MYSIERRKPKTVGGKKETCLKLKKTVVGEFMIADYVHVITTFTVIVTTIVKHSAFQTLQPISLNHLLSCLHVSMVAP